MTQVFVAKVKNVLSGDTVILVPSKTSQFPVPERMLTLSYVKSGDSYQSKEYLRQLLIGKEIKFKVLFKTPNVGKEFGDIQAPIFKSLIEHLLEKGFVKLKDNIQDESEYIDDLRNLESKAKQNQAGLWSTESSLEDKIETIELNEGIIGKSQKAPITTIVEKVISGDRVMGRIIVNKNQHITTPLLLAGIKCPRTDDATESTSVTKVAQEAKAFVEEKLLTTKAAIKVSVIGESQAGVPIAIIHHPSGNNIHAKLLENGFGEVVDWQSSLVGSSTMGELRKAEQTAKALAKGLYSNPKATHSSAPVAQSSKGLKPGSTITNASIAKVIGADTLVVRLPSSEEELTVQLASIRGPKPSDSTITTNHQQQLALVNTAREFVRQHVIGKTGTVYIDGYKEANKELGFDARFLVSFKINGTNDLSEIIVSNGMGTVIKHNKATAHERSLNWDKLVELEEEQKKLAKKGVFFNGDINKVLTVGTRIVDASENYTKAKTFFNGFKQKGRIANGYYVEFIPSVNRVKLYNPKEGLKLTLILGGLSNNKSEALGDEGLKYMNKKFLQRSIEFDVYDMDKIGGFIGNLYVNSSSLQPVQVSLLDQGLVSVHDLAVNSNPFANELINAEESAKSSKKGLWANYDASKVQEELDLQNAKLNELKLDSAKPKFFDIEVTDIDSTGTISYHVLDQSTSSTFASFKKQFADFHNQTPSASNTSIDLPHNLSKPPKKGEFVSAKFSENGKYYRGKVLNYDKTTRNYEVKHLDFGNVDKVPLSSLRVLPAKFSLTQLPKFAHTCVLQNLRLPPTKPTDYLTDALYALEDLTFDKKLVISALPSSIPNVDYSVVLYDSEESLKDPTYTINKQLVSEGWAVVDSKGVSPNLKEYYDSMQKAQQKAKSAHLGCWEFGDVSFDDEDTLI
ncbi:uncharacterized protein AC631_04115 [Debaryomyces fabryi]|uniref:Uncharacterized protein n=1 Tax=Debaryomyces fabryi TaxID=58627 RepID=A0A0V1PVB7_9ASCO|nr:uncharacterized protein AC631_04115 [Debaryomyces fabryi]KSA00114.1 hypothetical protein AC631_04115 [Debaryomyces fabryi]CUM56982.1 unnamed protein product [Debaryomyces fabryi]